MLKPGIYEQVLNKLIAKEIDSPDYIVKKGQIDSEEAAKVLAEYLAEVILKPIGTTGSSSPIRRGIGKPCSVPL